MTDYLLKPIEFDRFFQAVSKAVEWLDRGLTNSQPAAAALPGKEQGNYFFVKADSRIIKVELGDILFIEALQKYVCIHTATTRIITLLSMSQLQISLPHTQFCRVHRSYNVNLNEIDSIEGNMIHIGKYDLPISKGQRDSFLEIIRNKGLGW
ncbi:MAG TPA: LytTR family DNA-binding domain-containing protein [Chitinophagales bacterium]|nr:LytTR family DNA-binding domain-containing protein [Chitinophagales bacterium]